MLIIAKTLTVYFSENSVHLCVTKNHTELHKEDTEVHGAPMLICLITLNIPTTVSSERIIYYRHVFIW